MPYPNQRDQFLSGVQSKLAGRHSTLADDAPPRELQPGDKASIHVKKRDRYIPVTITEERWDAHGKKYHTATHANRQWAVELDANRFTRGWPDGIKQVPADEDLTTRARAVFLDVGVLRVVGIPTQLARAIANSLWPKLKSDRWREHTCTRDLAAYNPAPIPQVGPRGFRATPSAITRVVQHHERWISAMLYAKEWFGDGDLPSENYAIILWREAYDDALERMPGDTRVALLAAYRTRVRAPFGAHPNRHGASRLRRNDHEPAITNAAASALEAVARAAYACPVGEETVEAFHSGDIDLYPDMLSSVPRPVTHANRGP